MQPTPQMPDPTPEEIAEACAAIQATWSPAERHSREVGMASDARRVRRWRPPVIETTPEVAALLAS